MTLPELGVCKTKVAMIFLGCPCYSVSAAG